MNYFRYDCPVSILRVSNCMEEALEDFSRDQYLWEGKGSGV